MTDHLDLDRISENQDNPDVPFNDAMGKIDALFAGVTTLSIDNTNAGTISTANLISYFHWTIDNAGTPPTAAITITVDAAERGAFFVDNTTSFTVTVEITGQSVTSPTIGAGNWSLLTSDGVNIRAIAGGSASGSNADTLDGLDSTAFLRADEGAVGTDFLRIVGATGPYFSLYDTGGTSTHSRTRIEQDADELAIHTRDDSGTFAGYDLRVPKGASGATAWQFHIAGTETVTFDSSNLSSTIDVEITNNTPAVSLIEADGTSTHNQARILQTGDVFTMQVRAGDGTFKGAFYKATFGVGGATQHEWLYNNVTNLTLDATNVTSTKPVVAPAGVNAQTGTTYTLVAGDASYIVTMTNASANTLTIPTNASVAFATGTVINVVQGGAGVTTIAGDTGVTVNGVSAGSGAISAQYSAVSLLKTATNTWIMSGAHDGVA